MTSCSTNSIARPGRRDAGARASSRRRRRARATKPVSGSSPTRAPAPETSASSRVVWPGPQPRSTAERRPRRAPPRPGTHGRRRVEHLGQQRAADRRPRRCRRRRRSESFGATPLLYPAGPPVHAFPLAPPSVSPRAPVPTGGSVGVAQSEAAVPSGHAEARVRRRHPAGARVRRSGPGWSRSRPTTRASSR